MNRLVFSPELSYVIGVRFGDGSPNVNRKRGSYGLELAVTDYDFVKEFDRCLCLAVGKSTEYSIFEVKGRDPRYKKMWKVVGYSKLLIELLDGSWKDVVENYPAPFVRGIGDSEGSPINHTSRQAPNIYIENTNLGLLQYVQGILHELMIESRIHPTNRKGDRKTFVFKKNCYRLAICQFDSVQKYAHKIGFSIQRKQSKLEHLIEKKELLVKRGRNYPKHIHGHRKLSKDQEIGVVQSRANGLRVKELAYYFSVSERTIRRTLERLSKNNIER